MEHDNELQIGTSYAMCGFYGYVFDLYCVVLCDCCVVVSCRVVLCLCCVYVVFMLVGFV